MIKWIKKLFASPTDEIELKIRCLFGFLIDNYDFSFAKIDLGNAVDKDGRFFFYGPLNAYQLYNDNICINILYLVQRQDYDVYITDKYCRDQKYIRNGLEIPSYLAYDLPRFACEVRAELQSSKTIFGKDI